MSKGCTTTSVSIFKENISKPAFQWPGEFPSASYTLLWAWWDLPLVEQCWCDGAYLGSFFPAPLGKVGKVFGFFFRKKAFTGENSALKTDLTLMILLFSVASMRTPEPCHPSSKCARNPGSSQQLGRISPCRFCTSCSRFRLSLEPSIQ